MAHAHPPSPKGFGEASLPSHGHGHHASAEDVYLIAPPGTGHEHSDANVWIIVKFGLWLAISAIVISAGMGLLFALFVKQSEETNPEFPLAARQQQRLPAGPRLQQVPANELFEFRTHEEAVLQKYGWVNKEAGIVRIPIDDAMRLAVERGFPVRAITEPQQTPGLMPADSSSGRTMDRRRQ
jgi:hypothetical protein